MTTLTTPFLLGIDPGNHTGLAGYDPAAGRLLFVGSADPYAAVQRLQRWSAPHPDRAEGLILAAYLEDTTGPGLYARHNGVPAKQRERIARSVGRIDVLTKLYAACLAEAGVTVHRVGAVKGGKWDAETLERVTGWAKRTNEHGRDAARLVFGRTVQAALAL